MSGGGPITDPAYWDAVWSGARPAREIDPYARGPRNYVNRQLHALFSNVFSDLPVRAAPGGTRLIEIGCGASQWLPYFHQQFGFEICGIDYSEHGCLAARALLGRLQVDGQIVQADIFDPPSELLGTFDVVWTNGLVEHFSDTAAAVTACAALLRPGGIIITLVPNMTSLLGVVQRWFNRSLFDKHVPLGCDALAAAHADAGLETVSSEFVLLAHWGVLHFGEFERRIGSRAAQVLKLAFGVPIWVLGPLFGMRPNRITSPYLICVARRPDEA